jgi:hypothetical protein
MLKTTQDKEGSFMEQSYDAVTMETSRLSTLRRDKAIKSSGDHFLSQHVKRKTH